MKNFNFNFKSIVQSNARWLLTLIAILTLGVGQMWGATIYFRKPSGWGTPYIYIYKSDGYWNNNGSGSSTGGNLQEGPKAMTLVSGTTGLYSYTTSKTCTYVSFTKDSQSNYGNFWQTEAVYSAFDSSHPVCVPNAGGSTESKNSTTYYTSMVWKDYGTIDIYMYNTGVSWSSVYLYTYGNAYWDNSNGSGSSTSSSHQIAGPLTMTNSSGIYGYSYTGAYSEYIAFTQASQSNYGNFYNTKGIYRGDFSKATPLYIPNTTASGTNNGTSYYNNGSWVAHPKDFTLSGDFVNYGTNNWTDYAMTQSGLSATKTITITGGRTYNLKLKSSSNSVEKWYGQTSQSSIEATTNNFPVTYDGGDNITMYATVTGSYTFSYNVSTGKLSVTYPQAYVVSGDFNSWTIESNVGDFGGGNTATYTTPSLNADTEYGFKVMFDGAYYSYNGYIDASNTSRTFVSGESNNCKLATTMAGTYTFTINKSTKSVSVAFPTITAMTGTVGLSVSGNESVASTDGTSSHPYYAFAGGSLTLDKTHTSGPSTNSHFKYTYYKGSAGGSTATTSITTKVSTGTTSHSYSVGSTAGKYPIKVDAYWEYGPSGHKAKGTVQSSGIKYYQVLAVPTVALTTNKVSIKEGTDATFTLTATPSNITSGLASVTYKFFKGNSTAEGDRISTVTKTAANSTQAATCEVTPTYGSTTNSWVYTVQMTYLSKTITQTITIYRKWDIYVNDVCSWGAMSLYMWDSSSATPAAFPGTALSNVTGSNHWYVATLDTRYPNFKFNKGSNAAESNNHTASISTYAAGTYWYLNNCQTLTSVSVSAPTVTLSATVTSTNQINLTGNVSNCGGDGSVASDMQEVYFKVNNVKDASSITVSTSKGNFTKTLNNPTPDNTNNTLQAFAKNIAGTGESSAIRFTNVTLDKQEGSNGTSNVLAVNGAAMASGATAPSKTGYTFGGYYASTGGSGRQYYNASMASANTWDQTTATKTIYAKWTPKNYTVTLKKHNDESDGSVTVTYDASTNLTTLSTPTKTGYTFAGYYTAESGGTQRINGSGVWQAASGFIEGGVWKNAGNVTLHAQWTPITYSVHFYGNGEVSGTMSNETGFSYGVAKTLTANAFVKDGYHFDGWATSEDGDVEYSDGQSVINLTATNGATVDLYAKWTQSQIASLTFDPVQAAAGSSTTVTVTPVFDLEPTGTVYICWDLLYYNDNQHENHSTFSANPSTNGNSVTFTAPDVSSTYKVVAKMRTTNSCSGAAMSTRTESYVVAGDHNITVQYKCGDVAIRNPTTVTVLAGSTADVEVPEIIGYAYSGWTAGDGVTINSSSSSTANISAIYNGTLTINYTRKRMIYFNNTLGWSGVHVYFYKNASYWNNDNGTGANKSYEFSSYPYENEKHGAMTQIGTSNIWYYDLDANGVPASLTTVNFTELEQNGYGYFAKTDGQKNKVAHPCDISALFKDELPMYVPVNVNPTDMNDNLATYYFRGYWMNYPENTGYKLVVYDNKTDGLVKATIPFEFTGDKTMPMSVKVDLEAGKTYGFRIYRADDNYYGNTGTMVSGDSGDGTHTPWEMPEVNNGKRCGLTTTAAGDYTFTLYYDDGDGQRYRVGVKYPVAVGDFRLLYKDDTMSKWFTSNIVLQSKERDTVSFFIRKNENPVIRLEKCSTIVGSTITWQTVTANMISSLPAAVTKDSVYNICLQKSGSSFALENTEGYHGHYYIRCDVAGTSKWDNFKAADHLMQYSDYAAQKENFTHYFIKYVERGTNIKFVIANDYSPNISDTLIRDATYFNNMDEYGTLYNDGNPSATYDVNSANIRFMWNERTNAVSRAYIGGSAASRFLMLIGDAKLYKTDGTAFTNNEVKFTDDENFIYEVTVKVNPSARAKLTAEYKGITQYFKGNSTAGELTEDNSVEILGGTYAAGQKEQMRIVYDFKSNRLVCAWMPSDGTIGNVTINADVMIIREGQGDAQQIRFNGEGKKLDEVKNVYGVMRFNRWTLANKSKAAGHSALPEGEQATVPARRMYFISFPFDVKLSDIFGLGTYDDHWWIQYYDGEARARECFWAESSGFWKFLPNTKDAKLNANEGYILTLGSEMLNSENTDIWTNNIEQVEIFFPSSELVQSISQTSTTVPLAAYTCTETRDNRNLKDSHWHCMGIPSYANYGTTLSDGGGTITWGTPWTGDIKYLYTWNSDNSLSVQSGSTYTFKTMNAYMVQFAGNVTWSSASVPQSIAARRSEGFKSEYQFRLELQQNGVICDQTFVNLTDDEKATSAFDFNLDLSKEGNTRSSIHTVTSDAIPSAGNCLPLETEQMTTVPVGVVAKTDGVYTFAMPDGTEGISVTLVDNGTMPATHTDLSIDGAKYEVTLPAGTYDGRFFLQIDPRNAATMIDLVGGEGEDVQAAKILRNGIMYIQRNGCLYDATGSRVE